MIKAIAFDLDHTLFDRYETLKIVSKKISSVFKVNSKYNEDEIFNIMQHADRFYVHKGWDALQEYIGSTDLFLEKLQYDQYRKFVMGEFMKVAVPFSFTIPTLKLLKEQGYKLALITNGKSELQRSKIKMLNIKEFFDEIYIGGEHPLQKPNIEPFLYVAKELGVKPNEMAYIGDNPENDIEASRKAGCYPIHINTTKTWVLENIEKPLYSLETIESIPQIIDEINKKGQRI